MVRVAGAVRAAQYLFPHISACTRVNNFAADFVAW